MESSSLLKATLHIEVRLSRDATATAQKHAEIQSYVGSLIRSNYMTLQIGRLDDFPVSGCIQMVDVADFTGPDNVTGFHAVSECALDVQVYSLRAGNDTGERRSIKQVSGDEGPQARVLALPNESLTGDWDSLVFEDSLPSRILRYLVRMVAMMGHPGLDLATFNWNRLCLLHGPPGSGKSTLCRALAQKLSIRLGDSFTTSTLVEINANAMLSKYFGESGKLIESTFENIQVIAQDHRRLVVVVIDEVETIAGSRQRASNNGECNDGMRATNQLLTALDRLRNLPNIIVCCTSNLIEAIDPAFLDRVDIKQHVPCPSPAAIYNIFRSCLNELVRSSLIDAAATDTPARSSAPPSSPKRTRSPEPRVAKKRRTTRASKAEDIITSSPKSEAFTVISAPEVPTLATTQVMLLDQTDSPGYRVWALAVRCEGMSGRTLRRLPILGLAMYTWGRLLTLEEAVAALEQAVTQELIAGTGGHTSAKAESEVAMSE